MDFTNCLWNKLDFANLNNFLVKNKRSAKDIEFEKRIVNTHLTCYAIRSSIINSIVKQICHGNYILFLENCDITNYPISIIYGKVLTSLTDYKLFTKFFNKYIRVIDCWAHCDIFNLKIKKLGQQNIVSFVKTCIASKAIFVRRIGVIILLKNFINIDINFVFEMISNLKQEKEYYVNMAVAWLLCDCFIKQKDSTLLFIQKNTLNPFVLNKFISKCCDSYRVCKDDKQFLKSLRKKEGN